MLRPLPLLVLILCCTILVVRCERQMMDYGELPIRYDLTHWLGFLVGTEGIPGFILALVCIVPALVIWMLSWFFCGLSMFGSAIIFGTTRFDGGDLMWCPYRGLGWNFERRRLPSQSSIFEEMSQIINEYSAGCLHAAGSCPLMPKKTKDALHGPLIKYAKSNNGFMAAFKSLGQRLKGLVQNDHEKRLGRLEFAFKRLTQQMTGFFDEVGAFAAKQDKAKDSAQQIKKGKEEIAKIMSFVKNWLHLRLYDEGVAVQFPDQDKQVQCDLPQQMDSALKSRNTKEYIKKTKQLTVFQMDAAKRTNILQWWGFIDQIADKPCVSLLLKGNEYKKIQEKMKSKNGPVTTSKTRCSQTDKETVNQAWGTYRNLISQSKSQASSAQMISQQYYSDVDDVSYDGGYAYGNEFEGVDAAAAQGYNMFSVVLVVVIVLFVGCFAGGLCCSAWMSYLWVKTQEQPRKNPCRLDQSCLMRKI